jgi:hypothetical protein
MAVETTAATSALIKTLIKIFGVPVLTSAVATSLGFMFMWPKTPREAFIRIACTILFSTIFGPVLVIALRTAWPTLFDAARDIAMFYGTEPAFGYLFIAAPVMVCAGLPAWWIVGAVVRWFDRRDNKDIGELASDAVDLVNQLRGKA